MSVNSITEIKPLDIRRSAMDLLAFREHSLQELSTKLHRKFPDCPFIEAQLQILIDENLQSDQRFAEAFVRSKINKGHGPLRIKNELKQRGVDSKFIALAIEVAAVDWLDVLRELSYKKYGDTLPEGQKEKAKRVRFFQYRVFDYQLINKVFCG
jgi:regulatory protein